LMLGGEKGTTFFGFPITSTQFVRRDIQQLPVIETTGDRDHRIASLTQELQGQKALREFKADHPEVADMLQNHGWLILNSYLFPDWLTVMVPPQFQERAYGALASLSPAIGKNPVKTGNPLTNITALECNSPFSGRKDSTM